MFVSYPVNQLLVWRYLSNPKESFEQVKKFPSDKTDRDVSLMYSHCVAYTPHKPIAKASSVRGDEFCHRITLFRMFCPYSPFNKSVSQSDQAFILKYYLQGQSPCTWFQG